jgi:hypothetical protein
VPDNFKCKILSSIYIILILEVKLSLPSLYMFLLNFPTLAEALLHFKSFHIFVVEGISILMPSYFLLLFSIQSVLCRNINTIKKNTESLLEAGMNVGPEVNAEKILCSGLTIRMQDKIII